MCWVGTVWWSTCCINVGRGYMKNRNPNSNIHCARMSLKNVSFDLTQSLAERVGEWNQRALRPNNVNEGERKMEYSIVL